MCIRDRPTEQAAEIALRTQQVIMEETGVVNVADPLGGSWYCLLYTSDAADERSSVDLGGRRIIKKKKSSEYESGD
mgnify:CR=1 FL=1